MATKSCPISRAQFDKAETVIIEVDGQRVMAEPKEFSTGSFGWNYSGKMVIEVDGVRVPVQVGVNLTVVGSKEVS
jgi:hypothetical protein